MSRLVLSNLLVLMRSNTEYSTRYKLQPDDACGRERDSVVYFLAIIFICAAKEEVLGLGEADYKFY